MVTITIHQHSYLFAWHFQCKYNHHSDQHNNYYDWTIQWILQMNTSVTTTVSTVDKHLSKHCIWCPLWLNLWQNVPSTPKISQMEERLISIILMFFSPASQNENYTLNNLGDKKLCIHLSQSLRDTTTNNYSLKIIGERVGYTKCKS